MTLHDSRLPAGLREGDEADGAPMGTASAVLRLEFSSHERTDGWLRLASVDGSVQQSHRLADFVASVPCFTPHVALATESGPVFAGALQPGQRVLTRDHGPQEVRWVGRRSFGWRDLGLNPLLRPVRIAAGALGDGVPAADMLVSPNHRFLATMPGQELTDATERLWQARALIGRAGVHRVDAPTVDYVQVLLDRHELVMAEGSWCESFQPSGARLAALAPAARANLLAQLPSLVTAEQPEFALVRPEVSGVDLVA